MRAFFLKILSDRKHGQPVPHRIDANAATLPRVAKGACLVPLCLGFPMAKMSANFFRSNLIAPYCIDDRFAFNDNWFVCGVMSLIENC